MPTVGLRYFTVYGPRQRPDMAFSRFLRAALEGEPLPLFGDGRQIRDFTYVGDIVEGTIAAARRGHSRRDLQPRRRRARSSSARCSS